MNSKLKRPFNIREAGIIIQSQFFDWVEALMRLFLKKKSTRNWLIRDKMLSQKDEFIH